MSGTHTPKDTSFDEAEKIAERMSSKDYFLSQQEKLIDDWSQKSIKLFKHTGEVLKSQYEIKSSELVDKYSNNYEELYNQSRKEFEAYCILNRKVQKKGDQIQNFAAFFNSKNHKKNFFNAWKDYSEKNKNLRKMQERSEKYKNTRTLKTIMKQWLSITMKSNRNKIKNQVLQKTEIQISKIQSDYEKLIKTLEQTLQKKLMDLKKQEEEHKSLHDRYEAMYNRKKIES